MTEIDWNERRLHNCHRCGAVVTRDEYLEHLEDGCP